MEAVRSAEERPVVVSEAEHAARRLSADNLRIAALLLHTRGYVILRRAIPLALADEVRQQFGVILRDCVASKDSDGWYQTARETHAVFWGA